MDYRVHGFIDGAYLRRLCVEHHSQLINPHQMLSYYCRHWPLAPAADLEEREQSSILSRVTYYDAIADEKTNISDELMSYWRAVELLPETQLGFGSLRGKGHEEPRARKAWTL